MLTHSSGYMSACFANIHRITSRTNKSIYHITAERYGHTILNCNQGFNPKGGNVKLILR